MKIPKKLKVGAHTITVKLTDNPQYGNCGNWIPKENTIELDSTQTQTQLEVTLLHELVHACNISIENHELIEGLSQQLYQVIVDNKLVFDGKEDSK